MLTHHEIFGLKGHRPRFEASDAGRFKAFKGKELSPEGLRLFEHTLKTHQNDNTLLADCQTVFTQAMRRVFLS
jgi:hypothetical protein